MNKTEIYQEYFTKRWISDTGLGRLDPFPVDSQPWFKGKETVLNENGILFLAAFIFTTYLAGIDVSPHRESVDAACGTLEKDGYPGVFNRQPYGENPVDRFEAHDNYMAIAALSYFFNLDYAKRIVTASIKYGGNFNNKDPGSWVLSQQRQGGELAFYQLSAEFIPTVWEMLWLMGGLLTLVFRDPGSSTTQLQWMRLFTLNQVRLKLKQPTWLIIGIDVVSWAWEWAFSLKYGTLQNMFSRYYKPGHPIIGMAGYVNGFF